MSFTVYPAIDIRGGKCVRLLQGDYDKETVYGDSPLTMARHFESQGSNWIHVVDLDGAKAGEPINHHIIQEFASEVNAKVQVGGGIRNEETVAFYLENGVERVILGSSAISNPDFVKKMLQTYPGKVAIGIDAKDGYVAVEGWIETSKLTAIELGKTLAVHGADTFIFTDIARDGMLQGPNIDAVLTFAKAVGRNVIASGGVSSMEDLEKLLSFEKEGVAGAIIGKALYTDRIDLSAALKKAGSM